MDIASFLDPAGVMPALEAGSKRQAMQLVAERAALLTGLPMRDVLHALLAREKLGSTGVGRGAAIPHARFAGLAGTTGLFVRLAEPVEFEAPDGQPVDMMFVLLVPDGSTAEHVRVMARISRLLRDSHACEKIRAAVTVPVIYSIFTAGDETQET